MNIRYPIYEGVYRILTIELNIEEITRMYKDRFSPPKIQ